MTSKSAITPSFSGRIALIVPGVRPSIRLASSPTAWTSPGRLVDRDHRRLAEHDAAPAHVDERVGGAEVDGHVATAEAREVIEDAHASTGDPLYPARFRASPRARLRRRSTQPGTCCSGAPGTCRRRRRRPSCSPSSSRLPFAVDLVGRAGVGLAVRARLDGARDDLRRRPRVRLPRDRPLVRLPADPRPRAGADARLRGGRRSATGASAAEVAGVLLVGVGVVLVRGLGAGGLAATATPARSSSSLTIAAAIAAYTLVDRAGIQHAGALTYFVLVLVGPCLVCAGRSSAGRAMRARARRRRRSRRRSRTSARSCSACSRCATAAAAPVLAVRSSSVVIATLLAGRFLAEDVSRDARRRVAARLRRRRPARALSGPAGGQPKPYVPGKRAASSRTSSAPGRPTTFR